MVTLLRGLRPHIVHAQGQGAKDKGHDRYLICSAKTFPSGTLRVHVLFPPSFLSPHRRIWKCHVLSLPLPVRYSVRPQRTTGRLCPDLPRKPLRHGPPALRGALKPLLSLL